MAGRPCAGVTFEDRVAEKTIKHPGGCWEWTGCKTKDGYGRINRGDKLVLLHRAAWEAAHGPIPDAMCVCHKCDNPSCLKPSHLFLGTPKDNVRDMIAKGRQTIRRGSETGRAKLTEKQIPEIRRRLRLGERHREIAADYGISRAMISYISRGEAWIHVT